MKRMTASLSPELLWSGGAAAAMAAFVLVTPWWNRWEVRRHARRLEARRARGHDRYFEELRELEAYKPEDHKLVFGLQTVAGAAMTGSCVGLLAYSWSLKDPQVDAVVALVIAAAALVSALFGGYRAWKQAGPDPRTLMFADRLPPEAIAERRKLLLRLAGSVGMALLGLMLAWQHGARALEALL